MEKEDRQKTEVEVVKPKSKKPFKERFSDSWNKTDEHCKCCGAITVQAKGLNKQNVKRLFSFRASLSDWITLFIIIMVLIGAWSYNNEMKDCRILKQQIQDTSYKLVPDNGAFNLLASNPAINPSQLNKTIDYGMG